MGALESRVGVGSRANVLRRASGVVPAVHASQSVAANDAAEGGESAAEHAPSVRLRSPERTAVRAEVIAILNVVVGLRRVTNADLGAAINEPKETVRRMRAGALPLTADHLLRIARRRPELFEDIVGQFRGER